MVRPDLENIPELPLPADVEVRPVETGHIRQVWEASNDAFRDHWGYIPDPWEEYERVMADPDFDPSLWRVAWQDDQVAGMVLSYIDKDQNEMYGWKRIYREHLCSQTVEEAGSGKGVDCPELDCAQGARND
jgi:hypothetical protein